MHFTHLLDELRYVVAARYPVSVKRSLVTGTRSAGEDRFDKMLPALGACY